ncbi:MAG: hypothetical protein WCL14_07375 [Bacteroidota bacterium]
MVRPAIRCSRCIPIHYTKQRAAATIGAMLRRQVASNKLFISNLVSAKRQSLFAETDPIFKQNKVKFTCKFGSFIFFCNFPPRK